VDGYYSQQVEMYPNPAQNRVTLKGLEEETEVEFSTLEGRLVTTKKTTSNQLDISDIQAGYYLYKIRSTVGVLKKGKLVISRQ